MDLTYCNIAKNWERNDPSPTGTYFINRL